MAPRAEAVRAIIGHSYEKGYLYYRIAWSNYPDAHSTYLTAEQLKRAAGCLEAYHKEIGVADHSDKKWEEEMKKAADPIIEADLSIIMESVTGHRKEGRALILTTEWSNGEKVDVLSGTFTGPKKLLQDYKVSHGIQSPKRTATPAKKGSKDARQKRAASGDTDATPIKKRAIARG